LPAGFILYPWNIESREQTVALTKELHRRTQETTGTAPFLAVDQEGGRVQALRLPSLHEHPPARAMGVHADRSYMEAVGYVTAVELQSLGINMNFAPVLDLYGGSDVGVIGDRALAAAPEAVAELGVAYAGGLRRGGVVAVSKHFPGHGATAVDSHGALPRVERTFAELVGSHLKPFAAAAEAGVPAMMTAHIVYPRVEKELPATLSSVWLREILRDRLGFDGLIVTDALEMRAIADNYSLKETLHLGLEAGINVFLITTTIDPIEAAKAVETLVRHGLVSKEQIREGARRVLELKAAYGLLPEPPRR
jgi:beta-N-acetylhexosaminidase